MSDEENCMIDEEDPIEKVFKDLYKRISELEASSASHTEEIKNFKEYQELLQDADAPNIMLIPYIKKEIAELRNNHKRLKMNVAENNGHIYGHTKHINELKERNVHYHHWVQGKLDEYDNRILISETNREVLRELGEHYKENLIYMAEHTEIWDFDVEALEKLLAKLDSQGSSQVRTPSDDPYYACGKLKKDSEKKKVTGTDYKDPYIILQKEAFDDSDEFPFEVEQCYKCLNLHKKCNDCDNFEHYKKKDSGGEKIECSELEMAHLTKYEPTTDDPYYVCGKLKGEPREDDSILNKAQLYHLDSCMIKEWVKKNITDEILVKREDLQFLYESASSAGIYDENLMDEFYAEKKRIKEEYDIK